MIIKNLKYNWIIKILFYNLLQKQLIKLINHVIYLIIWNFYYKIILIVMFICFQKLKAF